jgi:hypothetical protein
MISKFFFCVAFRYGTEVLLRGLSTLTKTAYSSFLITIAGKGSFAEQGEHLCVFGVSGQLVAE